MREYTLYIWVGVWLLILPFLGIPGSWKAALTVLTALFLIGTALLHYRVSRLVLDDPEIESVRKGDEHHASAT